MPYPDDRPTWDQHSGFYRCVETMDEPWVMSPLLDKATTATYVYIQPFIVPSSPPSSENDAKVSLTTIKKKSWTVRRVLRLVIDWIGKPKPTPELPKPELNDDLPHEVELREWKAWGYYAAPVLNDIDVKNYPPAENVPSSIDVQQVFDSLRDPDGSRHPERWIAGLEHPAIPPRPKRWTEPRPGDPLPFPWEVQLNPFLQHLPFGPPPLCWNVGLDLSKVMIGQTMATIPLCPADKSQPATYPFLTHMYINAIADDPLPVFPWPIMVYNPRGIKCIDVFQAVYQNFQQHVALAEYESWDGVRQAPAKLAFEARWGQARDERMRRSDFLGTHCMFRGLEPHPNREGWMMFVGLA